MYRTAKTTFCLTILDSFHFGCCLHSGITRFLKPWEGFLCLIVLQRPVAFKNLTPDNKTPFLVQPAKQPASPQERGQWARSCQFLCRSWQNVPLLPGTHSPLQRCFGSGCRWQLDVSQPLPFPPARIVVVAMGDSGWHIACYWVTDEGHGAGAEASMFAWFVTWFVTITSSEISSFIQNKIKFYFKFQWVDIGKNVDRVVKLEAYWMSSWLGFIFNFPTFGQDLTVHSHIYFLCLND